MGSVEIDDSSKVHDCKQDHGHNVMACLVGSGQNLVAHSWTRQGMKALQEWDDTLGCLRQPTDV